MTSQTNQPHFVLFPLIVQGHAIPMIETAKLLAQRGVLITIVTTPALAARIKHNIDHIYETDRTIQLKHLQFPCEEVGLPPGCETLDMLPSPKYTINFFRGITMLKGQAEDLFKDLNPRPSCIISDGSLMFPAELASKFNVPRISFIPGGCFSILVALNSYIHREYLQTITSDSEDFILPGFAEEYKMTKAQLPIGMGSDNARQFLDDFMKAIFEASGVIAITFQELELLYMEECRKILGSKVWCIGPVSLCNQSNIDKVKRRKVSSVDEDVCLKWLDNQQDGSVIYTCFGSSCSLHVTQMIELGLGLEASKKPSVWVVSDEYKEVEKWIAENKFEERIEGRGFIIHGWAPQLLILSHPAVGGFLTHCSGNSFLEGIAAGLPLLTWPFFADHFCSEKLVVDKWKIGVRVGVEHPTMLNLETIHYLAIKNEDLAMKIEMLMGDGDEARARRERAKEVGIMAKKAVEEGGSSSLNIELLIQDVIERASNMKSVKNQ